jgi:hypothetical protein
MRRFRSTDLPPYRPLFSRVGRILAYRLSISPLTAVVVDRHTLVKVSKGASRSLLLNRRIRPGRERSRRRRFLRNDPSRPTNAVAYASKGGDAGAKASMAPGRLVPSRIGF